MLVKTQIKESPHMTHSKVLTKHGDRFEFKKANIENLQYFFDMRSFFERQVPDYIGSHSSK